MGINHGGLQTGVAKHGLDNPDIITGLKQVGCERVAESVGCDPLRDFGLTDGWVKRLL